VTTCGSGSRKSADPVSYFREGERLKSQGDLPGAKECYLRAVALDAGYLEAYFHLGAILKGEGDLVQATVCFRKVLALNNQLPDGHYCLGVVLQLTGNLAEAIGCYQEAIRYDPAFVRAWYNLGTAREAMGHYQEAIAAYRATVKLQPEHAEGHWNLGRMLLLTGQFHEGWQEYEWRWRIKGASRPAVPLEKPIWSGGDAGGARILVHMEQGYGDMIQFIRLAPLIAARGGKVLVRCPLELKALIEGVAGIDQVISTDELLPAYDFHVPILSLPLLLGISLQNIPAAVPYIKPDQDLVAKWQALVGGSESFRIGLVWQGNRRHKNDANRSCPLEYFAPLITVPGASFYSLQIEDPLVGPGRLPQGFTLNNLTSHIRDFSDTAAYIANLDLVITVDTAVAHLAGSMGKPVWLLLPFIPDWRWLLDRYDSPWYPTMRLFRQKKAGDWSGVLAETVRALCKITGTADSFNRRGAILLAMGQVNFAEECFVQALALNPFHVEALNNLGAALDGQDRYREAIARYRKAVSLQPAFVEAYYNMGNSWKNFGNMDEAIACYHQALALSPGLAEAHHNLALALHAKGESDRAIQALQQALALRPGYSDALHSLGEVHQSQGRMDEAVTAYRQALAIAPESVRTLNMLGTALQTQEKPEEAMACYRQALELAPDYLHALNNLGTAYLSLGQLQEAVSCFRSILTRDPEYADAHWNLALVLLMRGEFSEGWQEYEWRWQRHDAQPRIHYPQPQWDGGPLAGKTILLQCEQGFGDSIQFIRYAPLVAERGGRVIVQCQTAALTELVGGVTGVAGAYARGEDLPAFDLQVPLLTLPMLFGTTLASVPHQVPYLSLSELLVQQWREKMVQDETLRIGLVWSGRQSLLRNRKRSCTLEMFAPLAELKGVTYYSLQVGDGSEQAASPPGRLRLVDLTGEIRNFADTAAMIINLDLVISIDTSVAHLAGALGQKVWTMLPAAADWRWMLGRNDSPWYPSMRLFRQEKTGDWRGVIRQVGETLAGLLRG
jgi:tetratricopeptide (TPR) repeat protein